jgi:hypothetical protein
VAAEIGERLRAEVSKARDLSLRVVLCNRHKGTDVAAVDPDAEEAVLLFHPLRDHVGVEQEVQNGAWTGFGVGAEQ